eukprot:tig00020515_g9780.t1
MGGRGSRSGLLLALIGLAALAIADAQLKEYRTGDGTGNNAKKINMGKEGARFYRTLPAYYSDGMNIPVPNVSPRLVSERLFSRGPFAYNQQSISFMAAAFGQFVAHDLILTMDTAEPWPIPVQLCDRVMDPTCDGYNITFARLKYDPATGNDLEARVPLNGQTSFLDASTVYGPNDARSRLLRTFTGGELIEDPTDGCPTNPNGHAMDGHNAFTKQRLTGDVRGNVNPGILAVHCTFVLEHNWWARKLAKANPSWSDEVLYQEARARVIAEVQAITYQEYIPVVLGQLASQIPAYSGYKADVDPSADLFFAIAAYRYGHSGINSLYLRLEKDGSMIPGGPVLLRNAFFNPSYLMDGGIASLLRGLIVQPEALIDTTMVDDVRQFLFGLRSDLAAIDIQRGRDVGLPRYRRARQYYGLSVPTSFADITDDVQVQQALADAYGHIDNVDAWVGGLAEKHVPGGLVGPLFAASIIEQAIRTRDGDRFWFEGYLPAELVAEIKSTTLSDIMARAVPGIGGSGAIPRQAFRVPTAGAYCFTGACPNAGPSSPATAPTGTLPSTGAATPAPVITNGTDSSSSSSSTTTAPAASFVTKEISDSLTLKHWPIESNQVQIEFSLKGKGWVGIGIGSGMVGADMTICRYPDPAATAGVCEDYSSGGYVVPVKKGTQTSTLVSTARDSSTTTYTFKRLVGTSDPAGKSISTSGTTNVVVAWSTDSDTLAYHGPNRFIGTVDFTAAQAASTTSTTTTSSSSASSSTSSSSSSSSSSSTASTTTTTTSTGTTTTGMGSGSATVTGSSARTFTGVHIMHGTAMFAVWGGLVPAAVFTMRYLKHTSFWLTFHKGGMTLSAALTFSAVGSVLSIGNQTPYHFVLGVCIASLLAVEVVLGVITAYFHSSEKAWGLRSILKRLHPIVGYLLILLAMANVCIGLNLMQSPYWAIGAAWLGFLLVAFGIAEVRLQRERRQSADAKYRIADLMPRKLTPLTVEEIDRNIKLGAKWVTMGPYVYDVGEFMHDHPGGLNYLLRCVGRDIGYYFNGSESLDGDRPHVHGRRAHEILARLAVGIIDKNAAAAGNDLMVHTGRDRSKRGSISTVGYESKAGRRRREESEGAPGSPDAPSDDGFENLSDREGKPARRRQRDLPPIKLKGRHRNQVVPVDDGAGNEHAPPRRAPAPRRSATVASPSLRLLHLLRRLPRVGGGQGAGPRRRPHHQPLHRRRAAPPRPPRPRAGPGPAPALPAAAKRPSLGSSSQPAASGPVGSYTLIERELVTKTGKPVARLRFRAPRRPPSTKKDVRIMGEYYEVFATVDNQEISRYYSVCQVNIEPEDEEGEGVIDLYVKRYPNGRVSTFLHTLPIGQTVRMTGPMGMGLRLTPHTRGNLVAITAGTGIIPFLDLIYHLTFSPSSNVTLLLIACFESAADILLHEWLEACNAHAAGSPERRLELHIALKTAPPDSHWDLEKHHITGRVTPAIIDGLLPVGGPESLYICGNQRFSMEMGRVVATLKISPQRVVVL